MIKSQKYCNLLQALLIFMLEVYVYLNKGVIIMEYTRRHRGVCSRASYVELDENGNLIEKSDEDTIGDKNNDDSSSEETVDGNNGENTEETMEPSSKDTDNNENTESDEVPFDPNTQAPDEVLKSEVEQNENVVEENENTGEGNNTAEPNEDNSTFIPEPPVEEQPPAEVPSQSGGIPGEVLKSDLE